MKKFIKLVFVFILAIGLVGCSGNDSNSKNSDSSSSEVKKETTIQEKILNTLLTGEKLDATDEDDLIQFLIESGYVEVQAKSYDESGDAGNVDYIFAKYNGDNVVFAVKFTGGDAFDGEVLFSGLEASSVDTVYAGPSTPVKEDLNENGVEESIAILIDEDISASFALANDDVVELFTYYFDTGEIYSTFSSGYKYLEDENVSGSMNKMLDQFVEEFKTTFGYDLYQNS